MFFVNKDDPRLGSEFARMTVADAFDMVEKTSHLQGLVFYNNQESYVAITREGFPMLRSRYLS